jgi:transcriptional regulator with XRE-family HTH domain
VTLGDRIKKQRQKLSLTQQELANKVEVLRPRITELEANRRFVVASDVLKRLATHLRCSTDYLVGMYEDEPGEMEPATLTLVATE